MNVFSIMLPHPRGEGHIFVAEILEKLLKGDEVSFLIAWMNREAQWLSGRVLDSRQKGCGLKPHWRHCVVVLEQDTFILA